MNSHLLLIFIDLFISGFALKIDYDDFKVYRIYPKTKQHNDLLSYLETRNDRLDFWSGVNPSGIPVDVMVPPDDQRAFVEVLNNNNIETEIYIDNVQTKISDVSVQENARLGMTWNSYYRLEDIHAWMDSLPSLYHERVKVISAGKSYEGRDIKGVKISFKAGRRAVFIEGGMHAREWISPATATYIINELLTSNDPEFRKIAESYDWYVFPSVNPDGYVYTHMKNRLWRKTRTPYTIFCTGADPNRNWDFHWREAGTSDNPCQQTYGGSKAFSEVETQSLSQFISTVASTLDVYLAFHSYSQILLMPYGHTDKHLENYDNVLTIGKKAAEALAVKYGTNYTVGNVAEILYGASGSSMDWVKGVHKIPIVFTYELRDTGKYGFILPSDQIIPNCEEVMDSIVAMFKEAKTFGYVQID